MKIKITESQLKRIIEKYTEQEMLNEAWYDDVLDKIGLNFDTLKSKVKDVFKKVTGIELEDKDGVDTNDVPTKKEIEKKIETIKKETKPEKENKKKDDEVVNGNLKNIIIGDSTVPYLDNAIQKASRIDKKGGESSLWLGGMSVIWLIGALKKYPVDNNVENVIISMGTNGGFGKYLKYDVSELFELLEKKFPNADFIVVQGAWGFGPLKNIKDDDVKKYYQKYKNEGATVVEPPIGNNEPHGDIPIYKKIAKVIDGIL